MTDTADGCSCPEYTTLSRRGFLAATGVGAAVAAFGDVTVTASQAATQGAPGSLAASGRSGAGRVLVVLSLRGAVDGMSLVVPHGDPVYYAARPRIAVPAERLLAKDGFFGLHPRLRPLLPMWNAGRIAAVHATGLPTPNRSHFAAMEAVEDADPGSSARIGWLNRLVGRDGRNHPLAAAAVGMSTPPTALLGPSPVSAFSAVDKMEVAGSDRGPGRRRALNTMWRRAPGPLGEGARSAMAAVDAFAPARRAAARPQHGAAYPSGDLGSALASVARTIRGDVGAEIFTVDHGDWDHHANLGTLEWGEMQRMTSELAGALAAFFTDLGPAADRVTLVTISEFGRRTKENASVGLDHGHGNVMLLMGAGVKGGYYGSWTPLTNTGDGDLLVTTDYRSVLAEVASARLGASVGQVFPGFTPESVGAVLSL